MQTMVQCDLVASRRCNEQIGQRELFARHGEILTLSSACMAASSLRRSVRESTTRASHTAALMAVARRTSLRSIMIASGFIVERPDRIGRVVVTLDRVP